MSGNPVDGRAAEQFRDEPRDEAVVRSFAEIRIVREVHEAEVVGGGEHVIGVARGAGHHRFALALQEDVGLDQCGRVLRIDDAGGGVDVGAGLRPRVRAAVRRLRRDGETKRKRHGECERKMTPHWRPLRAAVPGPRAMNY